MRNFGDSLKHNMPHPARKLGKADAKRKMCQELYVMYPPNSVHDQDCGISSHARAEGFKKMNTLK
jgi:hypothetical protein